MATYEVTVTVDADSSEHAVSIVGSQILKGEIGKATRLVSDREMEAYENECGENGEVACIDPDHHVWAVSDENENYCYCEKCGCCEY